MPALDFQAPVGPLGYWLFAFVLSFAPDAQGLYAASWSLLLVTAPLMAVVVHDAAQVSMRRALGLLLPFLFFSILPFNVEEFYPLPGVDGFGIYNRQGSQLLYVLVAGLLFLRGPKRMAIVIGLALAALFLVKITAFLAAIPLVALGAMSGRIVVRAAFGSLGVFAVVTGALEGRYGLVGAYLTDLAALLALNQGSMLAAIVKGAAVHVGTIAAGAALAGAMLWFDRDGIRAALRIAWRERSMAVAAGLIDRPAVWLLAALCAGMAYESENWGGQAFIFLWPVVLRFLDLRPRERSARPIVLAVLAAATLLPPAIDVAGRALRANLAATRYVTLEAPELGPIAAVSARAETFERGRMIRAQALEFPDFYRRIAAADELPSYMLYADPEFQANLLATVGEGVAAIEDYEARTGERFETILSLNFVNPFPYLLGRTAPRHVAIGADPFRTIPAPDEATIEALAATDLVLWPKCIVTNANARIRELYRSGLRDRDVVALSPCWDGLVKGAQPGSDLVATEIAR